MGSLDIISIMTAMKALLSALQISVGLGLRIVDQQSLHLDTNQQQYAPEYSYDNLPLKDSQISKLAWAISPKLLPPPPDKVATEDNADLFYAPYYGADREADKEGDKNNDADDYYIPYLPYADKMSNPWLHYYRPLPTHDKDHLFQGPSSNLQEAPKLSQGLHQITGPKYDLSHEIAHDSDNEIFDVPKILFKSI